MNSRKLLQRLANETRAICHALPFPATVTIADTPASAEAILSNALANAAAICLFLIADTSAAEHYEDTHTIATLGLGLILNRPLQAPDSQETFQILNAANLLRCRLAEHPFEELLHPFPIYQGMEYLKNEAGRFINGYLMRFDCHYTFTEN